LLNRGFICVHPEVCFNLLRELSFQFSPQEIHSSLVEHQILYQRAVQKLQQPSDANMFVKHVMNGITKNT